jgi:hypothetical protein
VLRKRPWLLLFALLALPFVIQVGRPSASPPPERIAIASSQAPLQATPGHLRGASTTRPDSAAGKPGLARLSRLRVASSGEKTMKRAYGSPLTSRPIVDFPHVGATTTSASAEPEPQPETAPAGPPPPPPPPIQISNVHVVGVTPFTATVAWQTSEPSTDRLAYGLDTPSVWSETSGPTRDHQAVATGLTFSNSYRFEVQAATPDGRTAVAAGALTTPALPAQTAASSQAGALQVNGQPFFPKMVWAQCADGYAGNLAVGINLFMGNACGNVRQQMARLGGRALSVADWHETSPTTGAGFLGWHLPDEWDLHTTAHPSAAQIANQVPEAAAGMHFLTLTAHFYSHAEPLPLGRAMYPGLIANADVVGFDLYPLQNWCRYESFGHVFDSQRELVALAPGKPTFQWIEARQMDCSAGRLDVTPETLRAESWLAIAGGAHGIGYFPNEWLPGVGAEIARVNHEITSLLPALIEPASPASSDNGQVRVSARIHHGAVYVIAVNAGRSPVTATLEVPGLEDRTLTSVGGGRTVPVAGGRFTDTLAPLEVHVLVAAPSLPTVSGG